MTNYLFISNSSNFKIDNSIINQINSILHNENIQFSNKEIIKNDFYEWKLEEFNNNTKKKKLKILIKIYQLILIF